MTDSAKRYDLYADTFVAIAASGTVSAELAMIHVPAIIVYKMNIITMLLAKSFIRTRWVSLVNILLKRGVYAELLGPYANTKNVLAEFGKLTKKSARTKMTDALKSADSLWQKPDGAPAQIIANDLLS